MSPLIAMFCVPFFFKDILRGVPHEKNIISWCSVISKRLRNTGLNYTFGMPFISPNEVSDCFIEDFMASIPNDIRFKYMLII